MKNIKNPVQWLRGSGGQRDAPPWITGDAEEKRYRAQTRLWMNLYRGSMP